jgi:branched-chain amino acid transport system ATP-binding protein
LTSLEVNTVFAGYSGTDVLRGVSVAVEPGQCVGVLGLNGAGKSTLLRVITGQVAVRSGRRLIDSVDANRWHPDRVARSGVRWVGEPRPVFPSLTVEENLAIGGITNRRNLPRLTGKVYELLPMLREKRREKAASLSGGQQQMLAIGQALMSEPRYLCLDEPSLGLSPQMVLSVADLVVGLAATGIGILWAEQFPDIVLSRCSRVTVLAAGSITASGVPSSLTRERVEDAYLGTKKRTIPAPEQKGGTTSLATST